MLNGNDYMVRATALDGLVRAFAIFARQGEWLDWKFVRRILDRDGNVVAESSLRQFTIAPR